VDDALRLRLDILVADRVGLVDHRPAAPTPTRQRKLVVFTPETALEAVRDAVFGAGAGRIGDYERCSFYSTGTGTFLGTEGSAPTVGEAGREERVAEARLEVLYDAEKEPLVVAALIEAHPYEEPAFDLYPLTNVRPSAISGRIGLFECDIVERLRELEVGHIVRRRALQPGVTAIFTGLPGPCDADVVIAPAGDPDLLVPDIEAWALGSLVVSLTTMYTDGGARGNPGPAASAYVLEAEDGTTLDARGLTIGVATNNVAEYRAVIAGLERAVELGLSRVEVVSDSELVVKQMTGVYRIKNKALLDLSLEAKALERQIGSVTYRAVKREQNEVADGLVNDALDRAEASEQI
jgi:ribonuclease HI